MKFTFVPEYRFETFDLASAKFLSEIGVKGIILDIDNTLEPYENADPGEQVIAWLESLKRCGIKASIVSNNGRERVELFNGELSFPAYYKAKKPFKKRLLLAMNDIGSNKDNTVIMGDQVFTDVLAGRIAGIKTILVPPIKDKTDIFTKFKRLLEKPILRKYDKIHKEVKQ